MKALPTAHAPHFCGLACRALIITTQIARAELSAALCAANIFLAATLMRLAVETSVHDRLKLSHAALQKQAGGLTQEYMRATAVDSKAPAPAVGAGAGDGRAAQQQLEKATAAADALQVRCRPQLCVATHVAWPLVLLEQDVPTRALQRPCTCSLGTRWACMEQRQSGGVQAEAKAATAAKLEAEKLASDLRMQYKGLEESFDTLMRENEALRRGQGGASTSKKGD